MQQGVKQLVRALVRKQIGNGKLSKKQRKELKAKRRAAYTAPASRPLEDTIELEATAKPL